MPRADAVRNRNRLLEAAATAFAACGDPTLDQVARDAGVGIGTLYRHFPTREALVEAVYRAELAALCTGVDDLIAASPDAAAAARTWMDRYAEFVVTKRGMADTFRTMVADGTVAPADTREAVDEVAMAFLSAGVADGSIRAGIEPDDVVTLLVGLFVAVGDMGDRARIGRLLDLVVCALRPPA